MISKTARLRSLSLAAALLLASCAMGPDHKTPPVDTPSSWPALWDDADSDSNINESGNFDLSLWWRSFNDPVLDILVEKALDDNLDIRLQADRIREARARLGFARAERLPAINAQAEALRRRSSEAMIMAPGAEVLSNTFSVAALLNYEIDFWGRLARRQEAAEARLAQSVFTRDTVRLNIIADVAVTYFNLRTAQRQLAIARGTLAALEESHALERIRYEEGAIDRLVLKQSEAQLETTRGHIPLYEAQVNTLQTALSILTGLSPAELFETAPPPLPDQVQDQVPEIMPEILPEIMPSELLRRRPDIRAAEAALAANTAQIGAAIADRFPRFNLTTLIGLAAPQIDDLLQTSSREWTAGASMQGTAFDPGRGPAHVATAEAIRDQSETQYFMSVQAAFAEVRDALTAYQSAAERRAIAARQVAALKDTHALVTVRYREGYVSYIEVLDAQRALFNAELLETETIRDQFTATATLFKALGGGW